MAIDKRSYKNLLEELDNQLDSNMIDNYDYVLSFPPNFQSVLIKEVLERMENGDLYPYEEFKSLPLELQAKLFLLFDKEYKTSELAKKWGVTENTVYQWRHRIKKYISENDTDLIKTIKNDFSSFKRNSIKSVQDKTIAIKSDRVISSKEIEIEDKSELIKNNTNNKDQMVFSICGDSIKVFHPDCPPSLLEFYIESILKVKNFDDNKTYDVIIDIKERK